MSQFDCFNALLSELNKINNDVHNIEYLKRLLAKLNHSLKCTYLNNDSKVVDLFLVCILEPLYGFISMLKNPKFNRKLHANFVRDFTAAMTVLISEFLLNHHNTINEKELLSRIAYLNYVTNHIIETMTDEDEKGQNFYYIVVPNSLKDVRVRDISKLSVKESKFSVIYISEKLLMNDMEKAVSVACHEISHQVGSKSRLREVRYDKITNTIAHLLLYYGMPVLLKANNEQSNEHIITMLAKELSQCWKEQYNSLKEDYYLKTIREFIEATHTFTKMQALSGKEISNLDKMICTKWAMAIEKMDSELRDYIYSSLNIYYNTSLFNNTYKDFDIIAQVLYNSFSNYCKSISENVELLREHTGYCDIVIQAFSESYSDLQMIKYRNIADFDQYKEILKFVSDDMNSIEDMLRINAIKNILSYQSIEEMNFTFEDGITRDFIVLKNMCEYLLECKKISNDELTLLPFAENEWVEINPLLSKNNVLL